jgi:large repetitive protein
LTGTGSPPGGIIAGYLAGSSIPASYPDTTLNGDVTVNNLGNITAAAGDGIRAYTYGIGNVTVNDDAGTITALGGASPTDGFGDGLNVSNRGSGDILVTTAAGISIDAGGSGISALNEAPSSGNFVVPSTSQITVIAHGTITSGAIPTYTGDAAAGILAGYNPDITSTGVDTVDSNVAGNVLIDDYASITAAAATDGIRGFNYGTGSVTVIAETGAIIEGGRYGLAGFAYDGGDVNITNYATVTGTVAAVAAQATGGDGTVAINNFGILNGAIVSDATTAFENEAGATWNATSSSTFTGQSFMNAGTIEVTAGVLTISAASYVDTGSLVADGGNIVVTAAETGAGSATIYGTSQITYDSASSENITFATGATGELVLLDPSAFTGAITGFTGTAPNAAHSDVIDVAGIDYNSAGFKETYNASSGLLTLTDGTHTASLTFDDFNGTFVFASDDNGGTLIFDPPATASSGGAVAPTDADRFSFKDFSVGAGHESTNDPGSGRAKLGLKFDAFERNDAHNTNVWSASTSAKQVAVEHGSDNQHAHDDSGHYKNVLAALHANDFVLPGH